MNFKGKYTIIKKDKNGGILSKQSKYNRITQVGKQIILNLFKKASTSGNFKQMDGYKPLDLTNYKIKPLLKKRYVNTTQQQQYVTQFQYKRLQYYDYYTKLQFDDMQKKQWDVKSSFFFDNTFVFDGVNYTFVNSNKTLSYNGTSSNHYVYEDYNRCDYQLTNNGSNLKTSVDRVLSHDNQIDFTWSGVDNTDQGFLCRNIHNIDFFLVRCKQRIYSRKRGVAIPLWDGMNEQLLNQNITLTYPKVKFKYANGGLHNKSLIVLHRIKNDVNPNNWTKLTSSQFEINENNMTITFVGSNFQNGSDYTVVDQFMVFYNVYYLDDRLKNGICGMFLNYSLSTDNQTKQSDYLRARMLFGNGVFSYDGFKTLDDRVSFPWQGKPVRISSLNNYSYQLRTNNNGFQNYNNTYESDVNRKLYTTNQYIDYVTQRFYSFYPYVTKSPTNFIFMLSLYNGSKISIKNFVFLTPQLRTTTPRVFIFGDQNSNQQISQQNITNQLLRLDAIQCDAQSIEKDDNDKDVSLISWKTYIDYDVGNGIEIKQLGLACGTDKLQQTTYGWQYMKPIRKQQFDKLFSKVVLDKSIQKNEQQAFEVYYELVVG